MHKPHNVDKAPRFSHLTIAIRWALYGWACAEEMLARNYAISGRT